MHLRTNREILLPILNRVGGVVERRQTLPILGNVLISATDQTVQITGTDLEVEVRARFEADVETAGEVTLPARKFIDICRALPEGADIDLRTHNGRASLVSGRSRFALSTLPASDYPIMDSTGSEERIEIPESRFKYLLEKTAFAMAQQDVRYYLNGLLLDVRSDRLLAVATDGHRLSKVEVELPVDVKEEIQVIMPRKTVMELNRLFDGKDNAVQVDLSEKMLRVYLENTVLTSKLVDGRYPDYERVIPQLADKVACVDRDSLKRALLRTSILSNDRYKGVRLCFERGLLRLQAHNPEQEEAEEELELDYSLDPTSIGFNVGYLVDVLNVLEETEVEFAFRDSDSSALVRNRGKDQETYVVMPMRL